MSLLAANIRRLQVIVLCAIAALAAIFAVPAQAATYPAGFEERTIASGLTGPVGVAWTPDGRMLVIEKDGRLKVAPAAGGAPTTVLDISATREQLLGPRAARGGGRQRLRQQPLHLPPLHV